MADFNLEDLVLEESGDEISMDGFDLPTFEDKEEITVPHFKVATKEFLNILRKCKTIVTSGARDLLSKSVCLKVEGDRLHVLCTDFDVYLELSVPLLNDENVLEDTIVVPLDGLVKLAKALPSTMTIVKEDEDYKIRLIGGQMQLETSNIELEKFRFSDDITSIGEMDAEELLTTITAFDFIVKGAVNPAEKRILIDDNGFIASYLFSSIIHKGDFPRCDFKIKDITVLKNVLPSLKGNIKFSKVVDEKSSPRVFLEGADFKYAFLVGSTPMNASLEKAITSSDFTNGSFVEFTHIHKLCDLASSLNYATGKIKMRLDDEGHTLKIKIGTKHGDQDFVVEGVRDGEVKNSKEVEVQSKMFMTVLKAFSKNSVFKINITDDMIQLSDENFQAIILLDDLM